MNARRAQAHAPGDLSHGQALALGRDNGPGTFNLSHLQAEGGAAQSRIQVSVAGDSLACLFRAQRLCWIPWMSDWTWS